MKAIVIPVSLRELDCIPDKLSADGYNKLIIFPIEFHS